MEIVRKIEGVWITDAEHNFHLFLDNIEMRGYTIDNLISRLTSRQIQIGKICEEAKEDGG